MKRGLPGAGHVYGLKTNKGIAILQLAEEPDSPTSLQQTRICDGFLNGDYTDGDIARIVQRKELFFLDTPLRILSPRSRLYREYFAFDTPLALPETVVLPKFHRGYTVLKDGTVKWYKKRRGSNYRAFVAELTPDFLELSPDQCWSLPDLRGFLETGKTISDYR